MRAAEYAKAHVDSWQTSDKRQRTKITALKRDLRQIIKHALKRRESAGHWDDFYLWGEKNLSAEGREMLLSLLLEPHGHLVDELADNMAVDEDAFFRIPGAVTVGQRGWRWRKITLGRLPLIFAGGGKRQILVCFRRQNGAALGRMRRGSGRKITIAVGGGA